MNKSRIVFLLLSALPLMAKQPQKLSVLPHNPMLFGKGSVQQLVVTAEYADGSQEDVTARVRFQSGASSIASVNEKGIITAESNGGAPITAKWEGLTATTTALVQRADNPLPPSFAANILPILTKYGCNGGSCHGALNGQNGFKVSLFGYEPAADYDMTV